ncbi:MAG: hypothetical protein QNJ97_28045 [Myxococcota bacterium]|nr:hypothetical protein [Myxococcota bacterium]
MKIQLFDRTTLFLLPTLFLAWNCGHGAGDTANFRTQKLRKDQSMREAAEMKWNVYLAEKFSRVQEVRVIEFNVPPYVSGKASEKLLLTLGSEDPIKRLASVISVDEEQSGTIVDCLGEAHIALELVTNANDVLSMLVTTDSITPTDEGSLFFTEESKSKLREWFLRNIGRLPYGWDEGCGEE